MTFLLLLFFSLLLILGFSAYKIYSFIKKTFLFTKNPKSSFQNYQQDSYSPVNNGNQEVIYSDGYGYTVLKGEAKSPKEKTDSSEKYEVDINLNNKYSSIYSQNNDSYVNSNSEKVYSFFD